MVLDKKKLFDNAHYGMTMREVLTANGFEVDQETFWDFACDYVDYPMNWTPAFSVDNVVFDSIIGKFIPSSATFYYGIRPIWFIWHGEWSDPELQYRDELFNYTEVDEHMRVECAFHLDVNEVDDDVFDDWMIRHDAEDILLEYMEYLYRERNMEDEE